MNEWPDNTNNPRWGGYKAVSMGSGGILGTMHAVERGDQTEHDMAAFGALGLQDKAQDC